MIIPKKNEILSEHKKLENLELFRNGTIEMKNVSAHYPSK